MALWAVTETLAGGSMWRVRGGVAAVAPLAAAPADAVGNGIPVTSGQVSIPWPKAPQQKHC